MAIERMEFFLCLPHLIFNNIHFYTIWDMSLPEFDAGLTRNSKKTGGGVRLTDNPGLLRVSVPFIAKTDDRVSSMIYEGDNVISM